MHTLEIKLLLLGQAGVFIHYFKAWVEANKKEENYNLRKAVPSAALSSIVTAVLVYLKDDIADLYVVTPLGAVILGYFGNSAFFSFIETKKPKDMTSADYTMMKTAEKQAAKRDAEDNGEKKQNL